MTAMRRPNPRLVFSNDTPPPDAEQSFVDALAQLLVEDALHPPRRLRLRHRPPLRTKPELRLVEG